MTLGPTVLAMTSSPTPDDEEQRLFPTGEAAKFLGISMRTLYRYEKQGKITSQRLPGNHRRYRREDLEALLVRRPYSKARGAA